MRGYQIAHLIDQLKSILIQFMIEKLIFLLIWIDVLFIKSSSQIFKNPKIYLEINWKKQSNKNSKTR